MNKIDDLSKSVDRLSLDVENLKVKSLPSRVDINESIKAMYVSIDESKKRTAMLNAKRELLEKISLTNFRSKIDEHVKMIGVSSIDSLFSKVNLDKKETEEESTLDRGRLHDSEGETLVAKNDESGFEEVKTLASDAPTILDCHDFNYDSCSLVECISLLQSMLNSPNAYEQNKAFTKHIVEAMMKALEEKLEMDVSIHRKLYDEWEPTIKVRI